MRSRRSKSRDGDVHWTRDHFAKELDRRIYAIFLGLWNRPRFSGTAAIGKRKPKRRSSISSFVKINAAKESDADLVEFILDCARSEMCETCTLEVRKSNAHAQALYQSLGFKKKGTRPKIYRIRKMMR